MKYVLLTMFFFACGMQPPLTKPFNCLDGQWVCICDEDRNCEWKIECN